MSEYCSPNEREHRIQRWVPTGKYQAVPGKFLGIGTWLQSVGTRAWLHTEKGFSYVFGNADERPVFQSYGVPASALVEGLSPDVGDLRAYIARHVSAGITKFNIDEPYDAHKDYGSQFVITASNIVHEYGGTLFFSDYYHNSCVPWHDTINWIIEVARNGSPAIRGGTHSKWEYILGVRFTDPRDQWTRLHNGLAGLGRFRHSWIQMTYRNNASIEWTPREELELQFGHANNLGSVNTIFTWSMLGTEFSPSRVDFFLDIAVRYGWARRQEMLIEEVYCCPPDIIEPTVPPCTLAATIDTGQRRWA